MNFEHWRHYARGWLFHFFNREEAAYEAFATAFRSSVFTIFCPFASAP